MAAQPDGEPMPDDGALPAGTTLDATAGFGVYVHVPFCASRCGYCDFNTYAPGDSVSRDGYVDNVLAELRLAAQVLAAAPPPAVSTVFFGGGTPTVLDSDDLARILCAIDQTWSLAPQAEVTTEANPESVNPDVLHQLRGAGFTRISLGMQSTAAHVLAVLDRQHRPGQAVVAATQAIQAGFEHVNLDLIYGTPGETAGDFAASLAAALSAGVDHVSAYALIVEDGTRLAARIRRGELAHPDDDEAADRYLAADAALSSAGLNWYEVSNWAAAPAAQCRHNLLYWTGGNWWGLGPGAHSHVGGVRWWNVKHPAQYAARLGRRRSPGAGREVLDLDQRRTEEIMLRLRLAEGLELATLDRQSQGRAQQAVRDGLLDAQRYASGSAVLTIQGRLLADAVVRDLLP